MRATMKRTLALALLAGPVPLLAQTYGPAAADATPGTPAPAGPPPAAISPELGSLAAKAAGTHPLVEAARANVRAAGGDVRAAKWQRGPSFSVEALTFEGGAPVVRGDNFSANLVVDQPIWQGGRIGGTIDRARAVRRFSEAQADETMFDVELRVTNAYYDTVRATRRAMILERGLTEHRMLVESISRRVQQEVSPRVDLELARSRTAQLDEQLATAQAQRSASLQRLRELIGDPSYTLAAIPFYDPNAHHPNNATAIDEATTCSPTRKRAQAEALVARADAKLAAAQYMPRVSAVFSSNEVTGERVGVVVRAGTNGGLSQFEAASSSARIRGSGASTRSGTRSSPGCACCRCRTSASRCASVQSSVMSTMAGSPSARAPPARSTRIRRNRSPARSSSSRRSRATATRSRCAAPLPWSSRWRPLRPGS